MISSSRLAFSVSLGTFAAAVWIAVLNEKYFTALQENWEVALTMAFGSLVGGGTSEGGGAIGFPVLTKILGVSADTARTFTFAIQSIGMVCASICILVTKVPVEKKTIAWAGPSAIVGCLISLQFISPLVPLPVVRIIFTMVLTGLGIALIMQSRIREIRMNQTIPRWGSRERLLLCGTGFIGGMLSGVAGAGENTLIFMLLVLLFRVCDKVSTPTTVILMTIVSVVAFFFNIANGKFVGEVVDYWIAAAPIVAVGAPIGAWICTLLTPRTIRGVLLVLITIELCSTLILVKFSTSEVFISAASLVLGLAICGLFVSSQRYSLPTQSDTKEKQQIGNVDLT